MDEIGSFKVSLQSHTITYLKAIWRLLSHEV